MGLLQLPLLCLAFLGTRNVGQRINDSIFACSDFLGSLTTVVQFVSIRVLVLPGSKWTFRGLEKIGRDAKRWFVVRKGSGARVWELALDHHARRVMDPREVPL
jgi:uncharacterized protein HemY